MSETFVLYRFFAQDDRLLYVGMTRARESLILCQPATTWHVPMRIQ